MTPALAFSARTPLFAGVAVVLAVGGGGCSRRPARPVTAAHAKSKRVAVATDSVVAGLLAHVTVSGEARVSLTDPRGRRDEWARDEHGADLPGEHGSSEMEADPYDNSLHRRTDFELKPPLVGEYVVEATALDTSEIGVFVDRHDAPNRSCGIQGKDTARLGPGQTKRWGVTWLPDRPDTCAIRLRYVQVR
jgi:hypothetical protein